MHPSVHRYIYLNGPHGRSGFRVCPCFFYWGLEPIFADEWHASRGGGRGGGGRVGGADGGAGVDRYVVGPLKWLSTDPGRQRIGSFHPHEAKDWEDGVYAKNQE